MSLLLGVRGSSPNAEGQPFREGIIQQPGSFYNGNPSSSIWGPPTPPLWRDLPLANGVSSSSSSSLSTAVPPMPSSVGFNSSTSMAQDVEEKQWQQQQAFPLKREIAIGKGKQEDTAPLRAEEYNYNSNNMQQFGKPDNTYIHSDPSVPQFSSGFSSRPIIFGRDTTASNSFKFTAKGSAQELLNTGKLSGGVLDESGRKASTEANANWKNETSWKFAAADKGSSQSAGFGMPSSVEDLRKNLESRLSMQGSSLTTSSIPHTTTSEDTMRVVGNVSAPASGDSTCTTQESENLAHSSFIDSKVTSSEKKKNPEVFVFGASGSSGTALKSNAPQQKSLQSAFAASSSKSRSSKFKRQSTLVKGKGLAPLGGMQLSATEFSRDVTPQSSAGLDSNTESSHLDEAECSDAGIWPEENLDMGLSFEANEILQQPSHTTREKVGPGLQDDLSTWPPGGLSSTAKEDSYSHYNFDQHDHLSKEDSFSHYNFDQHDHHGETQAVKNKQNLGARFSSWWPFHNKSDEDSRHHWEVGGSSNAAKVEYNAAHSSDVTEAPSATPGQPDLSAAYGKEFDIVQNQMDTYPEVSESSHKTSSNMGFSTGEYVNESSWKFDSKEPPKPFVFGASQQFQTRADSNSERGYEGSSSENVGTMRNEKLRVNSKNFSSDQSIASELTSLFTSFSVGTESSTAVHEGPSSMDRRPFLHSAILTDNEPAKKLLYNVNSLNSMHSSSFVEHDNEYHPTGEFSGPLSSSESSASESSPTRGECHQESDKPFNKTQCFEFQGSTKERITGFGTGKKKSRASSNIRKQGRGASRLRRAAHSTSFRDTAATPMDYSPGINDAGLSSGAANLEQPYLGTMNMDDTEILRQLSEFQSMKDVTAAAAGLSIGNDQASIAFQNEKQASENLNDWTDHKISSKRSGKWKRLGCDEGQSSSTYWENIGVAQHPEREDEPFADGYTSSNAEESSHESTFAFGASPSTTNPFSLHRRFARRSQKEKAAETFEGFPSLDSTAGGPDGSEIIDQDRVYDAKVGAGYFLSQATMDKKGPSRALSLNNNQTSSYNRNAEEFAALNTESSLSGHRFVSGIPESPSAVKSAAAEQVCERWRLRGNQAYANGDFPKAEEYYSRGASSVSPDETSQSCIRASMLCYSNRAATRMAVGRMREALADCKRATVVDPSFLRVRLRAASCHLALGESKAATDMFKECLKYAKESIKPDNKILSEAMEGAKRSQQLDEYTERALELLQKQTIMDSTSALRLINEALSISSFSEPLHELKAQALLSLRRYEECLQLCELSLSPAERNHGFAVNEQQHQDISLRESCQSTENIHLKLWRWRLSAKALYHLGKLDESLDLLVKHEEAVSTGLTDKATTVDSLAPFLANIRDLLRHKAAGNEAFQVGKHAEAVEHYTAALACNGDSRPYNAVCFCNRAAASQALGHIADAIADCSRAVALDSNYPKALSRRATLHEMIRDYGQACNDLRRLITLLEDYQVHGKNNQATKGGGSNINVQDLMQARERLDKGEEEMKKSHPIDHYLVLGVDFLCSASEIKKAYRKAALKHHPDKAGQFLARGENGDDGSLWKEVGDEVRRDAERLFKLIGEAYAILSDPTKRLRYDTDEEHRKQRGKDSNNQVPNSMAESYRSQYEKSGRRQRDRWDAWQGYVPQHQRWQNGPDAAQPDTYGRRSTYGADPAKTGKASWNTDFSWDKL